MLKKILSNIIFGIVICMCGYLTVANVLHVFYLNKHDTFDFNSQFMTDVKTNINTLELNIEKISKLDNTVFTKEDLESVKDTLNTDLENIQSSKLFNYKGIKNIYFKDLMNIDLKSDLPITKNIELLNTLAKYDSSIKNYIKVYTSDFVNFAYNGDSTFQEPYQTYKYNTIDFLNQNLLEANHVRILARIYRLNNYVVKANYLATLVLNIGGDNNE